jgi:peptidoglycan/LPS O-acetylase OafA/YrhL
MSLLIVPIFCVSAGFVVFLGASGILIYVRGLKSRGSHSTRKERKAALVIGVASGLGLAVALGTGSPLNGSGAMIWMGVDLLIFLVTVGWVWRILTTRIVRRQRQ